MGLRRGGRVEDSKLRAAAEAIQYEDWAIDFNLVCVLVTLSQSSLIELYILATDYYQDQNLISLPYPHEQFDLLRDKCVL